MKKLKTLLARLFGSKANPSFMEMGNRIKEIADSKGETFFSLAIEYNPSLTNPFKFTGYINPNNMETGHSIGEVCEKLRAHYLKPSTAENIIQDVTLEK